MNLKQCPGCSATVDAAKAYCPDCGTPMDDEEKRTGSSEFDSLGQTQRLSKTTQFKLLEELNLSTFFTPPAVVNENESKAVETAAKPIAAAEPQSASVDPKQPKAAPTKPENAIKSATDDKREAAAASSDSNKKLYWILGAVLIAALALVGIFVLGILFRS